MWGAGGLHHQNSNSDHETRRQALWPITRPPVLIYFLFFKCHRMNSESAQHLPVTIAVTPSSSKRTKIVSIMILCFVNLINFMDRYTVSSKCWIFFYLECWRAQAIRKIAHNFPAIRGLRLFQNCAYIEVYQQLIMGEWVPSVAIYGTITWTTTGVGVINKF